MTTIARPPRMTAARPAGSRALGLTLHQFRYDARLFWRNPQSRFFTLILPVLFLLILATTQHGGRVRVPGGVIDESVYFIPGIMTLGIVSAALGNLAISVTTTREAGVYKRRRATPVPAVALIAARALVGVTVALVMSVVLLVIGWAGYHAHVPGRTAPALVLAVVVGAAAFCCLGFALASVIRSADAAQPIVQAIILPLYFISGVFLPTTTLPRWLADLGSVFPVRHLAAALLAAYNPHTAGAAIAWRDIAILAAWGVAGLVVALRRFSWLPRGR